MKKTYFLKTLFVAACLIAGVNASWADNVYTILYGTPVYDTDGVTITGVTAQTDFTSDDGSTASDITHSDANGDNCTNAMPIGGSVLYSNPSFSKSFETAATKGTVHFEANYTATTNEQETWKIVDSNGVEIFGTTDCGYSNGNATKNWGFCDGVSLGTGWFRQARKGHNRIVLDINMTTKIVSYTVLVSSGSNSYTTLTGTYNLPEGVSDVKGLTATKQDYYSYMDNVSFYNIYDNAVSEAAYTINYQLNGETVASESNSGVVGATVNAVSSIWDENNTQKYYVLDGETTSFTIAEGTNTFNVAVREAYNWTYSIKAVVDDEDLLTISTPSVVEGETASYGYPQYVAKDGVLYKTSAQNSNPWWGKSFTPLSDNETQSFTYTEEGTTGIVYCSEAENIEGITVVSGGNTDIRASNRKGGYGTDVKVTTLNAGVYKIYTAVYGNTSNNSIVFTYKAGETTVLQLPTEGNPKHRSSDEFVIYSETDLTVSGGNGGNSPKVIDYIIIQKISDIPSTVTATMGANGYTTFASAYNLDLTDLPEGMNAYTATLTGTILSFNAAEVAVPAGTGLLLKGDAGESYDIPVTSSADAVADNALTGVTEATDLQSDAEDNYIFVMKKATSASDALHFSPLSTESAVTVPAGKAYVSVPATAFSDGSRALTISFDGETTGISSTLLNDKGQMTNDKVVYNLNGQRVMQPAKGLYIRDGKKVIIK